jgi:hypothetical protein
MRSRGVVGLLVEAAILHDVAEFLVVLQDRDVGKRAAVDEQQVSEVTGLKPAARLRHEGLR